MSFKSGVKGQDLYVVIFVGSTQTDGRHCDRQTDRTYCPSVHGWHDVLRLPCWFASGLSLSLVARLISYYGQILKSPIQQQDIA